MENDNYFGWFFVHFELWIGEAVPIKKKQAGAKLPSSAQIGVMFVLLWNSKYQLKRFWKN